MKAPWVIAGDSQSSSLGNGNIHSVPGFEDARHDVVFAIMDWVEKGKAPSELVATKFANDSKPEQGVYRQRPLCVYPSQAVCDGVELYLSGLITDLTPYRIDLLVTLDISTEPIVYLLSHSILPLP